MLRFFGLVSVVDVARASGLGAVCLVWWLVWDQYITGGERCQWGIFAISFGK